jgi:hypothetical protein
MDLLPHLPDSAALRIFHSSRPLSASELERVRQALGAFVPQWTSHERPVTGDWTLLHDRFVVVAADERRVQLSGCSKDAVVRQVRALEGALGVAFVDAPPIVWRDGGVIRCAAREEFAELAERGAVGPETIVYDLTVQTLGDVRAGRFELPAKDSWHARAFDFAAR